MPKPLSNWVSFWAGLAVPLILTGITWMYSDLRAWGLAVVIGGLVCGLILWIVVFAHTRGLLKSIADMKAQVQSAVKFVSTLQHCEKSCIGEREGWPFGQEYRLLHGRDKALETCASMLERSNASTTVKFVSSGLHLEDAWGSLLAAAAVCRKNLTVIVSKESKVSLKDRQKINILAGAADVREGPTYGIRLLVIKDENTNTWEGYFCNSKSVAERGNPKDYWTIFSTTQANLKMMELVFASLLAEARPLTLAPSSIRK